MNPKFVVSKFLSTLAVKANSKHSLSINISNDPALDFPSADVEARGFDWSETIGEKHTFDFIVANLPLGMARQRGKIGESMLSARRNWFDLAQALRRLDRGGLCLALVEPPGFGLAEGPAFLEALKADGYSQCGVFNTPKNLYTSTTIRPVLVAFTRGDEKNLFAAELEEEVQAIRVAEAFLEGRVTDSLAEGIACRKDSFAGFGILKTNLQLERLETQYKEYRTYTLGEIAEEINTVRSGQELKHKDNSIYVPMLGKSPVTHKLSAVTIKHHNVFQVVLTAKAKSEFVSAYFQSDLGLLSLRSMTIGAWIPKITKATLLQACVALPELPEQEEIIHSHEQIQALTSAIEQFQKDLALNPRNASAIRSQVEGMLEKIGVLTEAERIMNMAREGESATVEFKESFGLDVKKGIKERHIELSSMKTIAAFLNSKGGTLLIGVADSGEVRGIGEEISKFYKKSADKFLLHFKDQLKSRIGEQFYPFVDQKIVNVSGAPVLTVACKESPHPCFLDGLDFYVRTNPATDKLEGSILLEYVANRFSGHRS